MIMGGKMDDLVNEIMDKPNDRTNKEEFEYRRGYTDGFEAAIEALQDNLEAGDDDFEDTLECFWRFRWTALKGWTRKSLDRFYFPPKP
jgi:hypothetical protein